MSTQEAQTKPTKGTNPFLISAFSFLIFVPFVGFPCAFCGREIYE